MEKKDKIEEISQKASGEALISYQLENIRKKWSSMNFKIV